MGNDSQRAWISLAVFALVLALLVFPPAGTLNYWQGWLYLAAVIGASAVVNARLILNDPDLLRRRMKGGPWAEARGAQRIIMSFASLGFIALVVAPALEFRWRGASVNAPIVVAADIAILLGFAVIDRVYRANTFAAATIEVAAAQRVIDTGPYAVVRHPMYAGGLLYLAATPLALGSWRALLIVVVVAPFLIWRLIDEERLLLERLPSYADYRRRTKWRLVPGVF